MKKILFILIILFNCCPHIFAHVAKKEVKKDTKMLELEQQVKTAILEQGDYNKALKLFATAAREQTDQPYYKEQYAILRRVIKMKRAMQAEQMQKELSEAELKKWNSYYSAVRAYYYDQGLYSESIELDKTASEKLGTDQSIINYLETLAVLDKVQQAEQFISTSSESVKDKTEFVILESLFKQRAGNAVNIQELDIKASKAAKDAPRAFVYLACIYQLQDNQNKALQSIVKALENTPPTQITMTRKLITNMKEFNEILKTDKYQRAMETESKIYQSGCTGGSSCNSCSLRETCPSKQ
jgi:tetratricopeptide (TPR) repeat protein